MKTILVLGAGIAAVPVIHQTMKTTVLKSKDLKMIVVNPTDYFLWPIAMPRLVVPGQLPDSKVIYELPPAFKNYPADKFEFVRGSAAAVDAQSSVASIALNSAGTREIAYDVLIIATGSSAKENMPWKMLDTSAHTFDSIHSIQQKVKSSETIVVVGGGATGIETAGELGFEYAKNGTKDVYFIHSGALPLGDHIKDSVRKQARDELEKLNVKIISNTTVTSTTPAGDNVVLQLTAADGTTKSLTTGAYLPTMGMVPNTSFLPPSMLDTYGFVKQTTTLQAEGHKNIFVIGDAGSLEGNMALAADAQANHLIKTLPAFLKGDTVAEYKKSDKVMMSVTVGRARGTGQVGSFKIFSFLVWYLKGRFLGTDYVANLVAGKRSILTKFD